MRVQIYGRGVAAGSPGCIPDRDGDARWHRIKEFPALVAKITALSRATTAGLQRDQRNLARSMSQLQRITFNPNQFGGRPCIRSMRIRVKDVLDMLASGASQAEILENYSYLEREDIQASLEYAARQVDHAVLSLAK